MLLAKTVTSQLTFIVRVKVRFIVIYI